MSAVKNRLLMCIIYATNHLILIQGKSKDILKTSNSLIESESERVGKCPLTTMTIKNLNNLRYIQHKQAIDCHIEYASSHMADGWIWSALGTLYTRAADVPKSSAFAANSFKQANKLSGKVSSHIAEWLFIGPFVIGKGEVDGDPVESSGGIKNIAKRRLKKGVKFISELADKGEIGWEIMKQSNPSDYVRISPKIDWNDLINSLGSIGIMEWQGWIVGEFAVNDDNVHACIQCHGVHTLYIDDILITGDVYSRDWYWISVPLSKGIHTVYIRLRAKATQQFKCNFKHVTSTLEVLQPHYLPDLYNGYLFSHYISLPITNLHTTQFITDLRISIQSQEGTTNPLSVTKVEPTFMDIAPGQTKGVILKLSSDNPKVTESCQSVSLKLKIKATDTDLLFPIKIRCRNIGESFLFTFLDHDGSVQHGAAIQPHQQCQTSGTCSYPVVLTLHGTTVPPQNQADSYKRMVDGDFVFGYETAWVVAPTRHGAHNWEGPGALTAMEALDEFAALTVEHKEWLGMTASADKVVFAGHSMGGHGAWHLATHFPDRALGVVSLAGWIKKEEYGDSNLFFRHDIATSHTDVAVKMAMEACIAENDADRLVSNLQDLPVMIRIGAKDRTIHPYFNRRMNRLVSELKINVTYVEVPNQQHWWWDTKETNDGGCVHDEEVRTFTTNMPQSQRRLWSCDSDDPDHCEEGINKYSRNQQGLTSFTYTVLNPAFTGSMEGFFILEQVTPFRKSTIHVNVSDGDLIISTVNVRRFSLTRQHHKHNLISAMFQSGRVTMTVDGIDVSIGSTEERPIACSIVNLSQSKGLWTIKEGCQMTTKTKRSPSQLGPARRVAEKPFIIVTGTQGGTESSQMILTMAVYFANLFFLTSDAIVSIVKDTDLTQENADKYNLIILGGTSENSFTSAFIEKVPLSVSTDGMRMGSCRYTESRTGALFLAPHTTDKLALVLLGNSIVGLRDVVTLATPTIPPMTRSPFSNMVPDFVITGPKYGSHGPGGYLCTGFWSNTWTLRPELVSCSFCADEGW